MMLKNKVVRKMDSSMHIELECVFNVVMARNGWSRSEKHVHDGETQESGPYW
jgi:hypothetical protein